MQLELEDRCILVAGSSRGIGRGIAEAFLREGARTIVTGRTASSLRDTESQLVAAHGRDRVYAIQSDLATNEGVIEALSLARRHWGPVEGLVANIGAGRGQPGWSPDQGEWLRLFEVNLFGATRLATQVASDMVTNGGGCLVFVGSIAGVESIGAPVPYSAAKAALLSYSKNLARQLGPLGVRVNCVAPGNILFPDGSWDARLKANRIDTEQYIRSEVPLQRFGTVEDVANAVVFLASRRASFITGSCVVIDGGQTRGW